MWRHEPAARKALPAAKDHRTARPFRFPTSEKPRLRPIIRNETSSAALSAETAITTIQTPLNAAGPHMALVDDLWYE